MAKYLLSPPIVWHIFNTLTLDTLPNCAEWLTSHSYSPSWLSINYRIILALG